MKKLTVFLSGCFLLSVPLAAQTYVTKHTANAAINPLGLDYSSFWATPVELHKYDNNDFSIVHYNEGVNGNIVVSRSFGQSNPLLILNPILNVPTGSNYLVISRNNSTFPNQIVLTHVNFALNSVIFSTQFSVSQSVPGQTVSGLTPIDAVYDGSQYVYLLLSGTSNNPNGRKLFLVAKIDLTNPVTPIGVNQIQSWGSLIGSSVPFHFYPNDIEYVNDTCMFVTGTAVNVNTAAVHFFVYNIHATLGTYNPFYITQSVATYVPQRMFVQSDGANVYFIGENKLSSGAYGPTLFSSYDITAGIFGINNYTNYYDVVDWTNMTSSYYDNNEIVVGGKLSSTPTNRSANLLFNTSTGMMTDLEYYTMSTNPARSIISPASGRVFSSVKVSTTEWDVFRTGVSNLTTPCKSVNMVTVRPPGTMNIIFNNLNGYAFSPSFSGYAVVPVSPVFTTVNHCGTPDPEEGRAAGFSVAAETFSLYPNPSQGSFSLLVYSEQEGLRKLQLHDLSGRQVYARTITVGPGENTINLAPEGLKPGIYLLRLEGSGKTVKLVIQE